MKKNEGGQVVAFQAVSSTDGSAVTTGSPTVYVTIDGGTQATGANTAIHEGQGSWSYVPTQAETNGDHVVFTFTLSGCINQSVNVYPVIVSEYQATGFSTFDHTTDEVTTDAASRTASQATAVDILSISGSTTAADNLEAQYDGATGLAGDLFPATQGSVKGIGTGTTGSINFKATGDNTGGPIKGATFTGSVVSGSYTDTDIEDGVVFEIDDTGNVIDVVLSYDLGGSNQGTEVEVFANLNGNADLMDIQVYNFDTSAWETGSILQGSGGTAFQRLNISLLSQNTGTGADLGMVYVRFSTSSTSPNTIEIDKVIVGAISKSRSVGYADGAVWVSSTNGVSGIEPFVNGVADNPCTSYANAISIASNVGLSRYKFDAGDLATLTQSHATDSFSGYNYRIDMNNQEPPTYVEGAEIVGTCNGPSAHYVRDCRTGTVSTALTLNKGAVFVNSGLVNVALLDSAGAALDVEFLDCHGNTQGSMFPGGSIDFGTTAGTNHEVSFQRWGGPVTIVNLKAGDTVYAHGNGTFILDASCTGGSFRVAGMINLVDNSGLVSVLQDGRITKSGIADAVLDEVLSDHSTAGTFGKAIADIEVDTNDLQTKIIPMLEVDGAGGYQYTTLALENAPSGGGGSGPTADEIADAVWDEAIGDHVAAGSFGAGVRVDQASADAVIGPAVWDMLYTGYTGADLNFGTLSFQQAMVTNSIDAKVDDIQGATFDTATDSLEAIRDRGDAAWVTGGGGGGIWQLTVTVTDTSANAVQGARVAVDGTSLTVTTDTSGEAVLNLNDGGYTLNISAPSGYDDPAAQSVTINGADATLSVVVSPTSGSGSCEIPPL